MVPPDSCKTAGALRSVYPDKPLIVCLHGGGYNGQYFDVPGSSMLEAADAAGFDTVTLDRPNYGRSDALPPEETTFARNAQILSEAIQVLWDSAATGHPGVVIIGHSIGGAIGMHIAAAHPDGWPLLGLSLSGVNELSPEHVVAMMNSMPDGVPVDFSPEQRQMFMYGPEGTYALGAVQREADAGEPAPVEELREIVRNWLDDLKVLAPKIDVPIQYTLTEHDQLWVVTQDQVDLFSGRFTSAPSVSATLLANAGHNIDHHLAGPAWQARQLQFALSTTTAGARQ